MRLAGKGAGKSFGIQEVLDQIGAFLGPGVVYRHAVQNRRYHFEVYVLLRSARRPGAATLILLLLTKRRFPNPERFEPEPKEYRPFQMKREFVLYIAGISLFAFGFIDYSIVIMHLSARLPRSRPQLEQTAG